MTSYETYNEETGKWYRIVDGVRYVISSPGGEIVSGGVGGSTGAVGGAVKLNPWAVNQGSTNNPYVASPERPVSVLEQMQVTNSPGSNPDLWGPGSATPVEQTPLGPEPGDGLFWGLVDGEWVADPPAVAGEGPLLPGQDRYGYTQTDTGDEAVGGTYIPGHSPFPKMIGGDEGPGVIGGSKAESIADEGPGGPPKGLGFLGSVWPDTGDDWFGALFDPLVPGDQDSLWDFVPGIEGRTLAPSVDLMPGNFGEGSGGLDMNTLMLFMVLSED